LKIALFSSQLVPGAAGNKASYPYLMGSWVSGLFLPRVCPGYWTSSRRGTVSAIFSTLAGWVLGPPLPCHHRLSASGIYQLHTQSVAVPLHFPKGPSLFISVPLWFGKHFHISLPLGFLFCSSVTVSLSWVTFFCPVTSLCVCVCVCVKAPCLPSPGPTVPYFSGAGTQQTVTQ
jgi:hypothetical protein